MKVIGIIKRYPKNLINTLTIMFSLTVFSFIFEQIFYIKCFEYLYIINTGRHISKPVLSQHKPHFPLFRIS